MGFGEEEPTGKVEFLSYHIQSSICYPHDLPVLMLTLITWLSVCLSSVITVKPLFPPSLPILDSSEGSHCAAQTYGVGTMLCSFSTEYLYKLKFLCMGDLYVLLYLLIDVISYNVCVNLWVFMLYFGFFTQYYVI